MKIARRSLFEGIAAVLLARAVLKLPEPVQQTMMVFVTGMKVGEGIPKSFGWTPWASQHSLLDDTLYFISETKP